MDEEDFCGNEYQRGLGRVWVCSLPDDDHQIHIAYPWHNIGASRVAEWHRDGTLLGYDTVDGAWMDLR